MDRSEIQELITLALDELLDGISSHDEFWVNNYFPKDAIVERMNLTEPISARALQRDLDFLEGKGSIRKAKIYRLVGEPEQVYTLV